MFWYNYFMDRDFSRLCTQDGYHHRGHSKAKPLVHLVFVTKYRKLILTGSFGIDVKQILFESAKRPAAVSARRQYPAYRQHSETGKHLLFLEDTSSRNACPVLLGRTYIMVGWVLCGQHWKRFGRNNPSVYRQPVVNKNAPKGATFPYEIDEEASGHPSHAFQFSRPDSSSVMPDC